MIKAVLFDFDETLQDRTLAFEHYMDNFFKLYLPKIEGEELEKRTSKEYINTKVDNVVTTMKTDFKKWYNANFSDLSTLDDIKLEFPKDIYDFIVNPWKYLDEDAIFNGPWN